MPTPWIVQAYENLLFAAWIMVRDGEATGLAGTPTPGVRAVTARTRYREVHAIARELHKNGKQINRVHFGAYYDTVADLF